MQSDYQPNFPDWMKGKVESSEYCKHIIDGCFMPDLTVKRMGTEHKIKAYRFVFGQPDGWNGWAIFTINDSTGEFHIQSDWGNYQHRWNIEHLGKKYAESDMPLTRFLADMTVKYDSAHYVTDKLHYDRDDREVFDEEETLNDIERRLLEKRRCGDIEAEDARDAWDELQWLELYNTNSFMYTLREANALNRVLHIDYEDARHKNSFGVTLLQYKLLPFFFRYLRREVLKTE